MRCGEKIWLCKKISDAESDVHIFGEPIEFTLRMNYLTVQPAGGYLDVVAFGAKVSRTWKITAVEYAFRDMFHEGDLVFVGGAEPMPGTVNGTGANAIVTSVQRFSCFYFITIERQDL